MKDAGEHKTDGADPVPDKNWRIRYKGVRLFGVHGFSLSGFPMGLARMDGVVFPFRWSDCGFRPARAAPEKGIRESRQLEKPLMRQWMYTSPMPASDEIYRHIFETAGDGLIINDAATGHVVEANPAAAAMHGYAREEFIGLHPADYLHPDSRRPFSEDIEAAQSGKLIEALVVHIRRDNSQFYAEVRRTALTYRNRPCILSVIRDVNRRVQAEQLLRQRVEAHAGEQSVLLEISRTLASTLKLHPGIILEQFRKIIEYTRAGLFVPEDSNLVVQAVRGRQPSKPEGSNQIRMENPDALALLFDDLQPIQIADVSGGDPASQSLRSLLGDHAGPFLTGMKSWMWVPIAVKSRIIGAVGMAHEKPDFFTAHHANLALTVANQAATTMVNADLYEHARELATLQERQRLAQNLHDAVNQSLFSAGLIAEVLPRLWERDQDEARRSLEDLRRLTRGALAEMRALLAELRPSTLTDAELGDLLRLLSNAFTGRTNIPVAMSLNGEGALPAEPQVAFYRICQEALNNIAKHAKASQVEIILRRVGGEMEMHIRDNGCGFIASEPAPSGHYGLGMMRERAEAVNAELTVSGRPGLGTEITLLWREAPKQEVL
jgi:PAS domain S-box-containing protein